MVALELKSPLTGGKTAGTQSGKFGLDLILLEGDGVGLVLLGPEIGDGEALFEVCAEIVHPAYGKHDVHAELGGALVQEGLDGSREWHLEDFEIGPSHYCGIAWTVQLSLVWKEGLIDSWSEWKSGAGSRRRHAE